MGYSWAAQLGLNKPIQQLGRGARLRNDAWLTQPEYLGETGDCRRPTMGYFAVNDHLRRRAFVAETLLFDHLLVPVPAEEEQDAYMNWEHKRWEPKEALETVEVLGDLAIPVPWSETLRDRYRDRYGRALLGED